MLNVPSRAMKKSRERDFEILTAIGEGRPLSQRVLAQRLGVALGLTNLLLKRLARKGSIKIVEFPKKPRSEEHTSELQSRFDLVCRLLLEKKKKKKKINLC